MKNEMKTSALVQPSNGIKENIKVASDSGVDFITVVIHVSVATSESTHWLPGSHRLGPGCFTAGVPDGVKDQRSGQRKGWECEKGHHSLKKCQGASRARSPVREKDFNNLFTLCEIYVFHHGHEARQAKNR